MECDPNAPKIIGGGMTFGGALEALKIGYRVRRIGWYGGGMWASTEEDRAARDWEIVDYPDAEPAPGEQKKEEAHDEPAK